MKTLSDDPLWFKSAVIYQLHVKAFADSDGDGIGDFRGLIGRLDYLADLGVTALWLLPFYPSPLRDDGYDISDYTAVHPSYGTLDDFKEFLQGAHQRGMRVITELVLNHTSDQHAWFQRARQAPPGSEWRDYYVWSDTPERYRDVRIIFKDFEPSNWTWDPVAKAYYWHRFYSHQPDLNFDSPEVQREVLAALEFWLDLGVDGMRLDAVPYLCEREGTTCENLPETHVFLRRLRAHIDARYRGRMLLAEANMWPEDAVTYFGNGDECHMAFHFPLMPRLFMALQMEDRFPLLDILEQTPAIPATCQWALFLRNHDELTLEMVTDEERDYMYRVYAADPRSRINLGIRRRLAPLLGNSRRKMELMITLLLSLPGTPVLYYGDEIGMGDNIYLGDRNGVRTPMQWSPDRNAGFSRANPQQLHLPIIIDPEYHYEALNVETQDKNLSSPLWWTRRVVAMRRRFRSFGLGGIEFLLPDNPKVLVFVRRHEDETMLVLANLSRFAQSVELDLSAFAGRVPVEVFGSSRFPPIRHAPYVFTLSPHGYYWLKLELENVFAHATFSLALSLPSVEGVSSLAALLFGSLRPVIEEHCLPRWLQSNRWFAGKAKTLQAVKILEAQPLDSAADAAYAMFVEASYVDGSPEVYFVPLQIASGGAARRLLDESPHRVVARLSEECVLYDAMEDSAFRAALFALVAGRKRAPWGAGEFVGEASQSLDQAIGNSALPLPTRLLAIEQSNTSILVDGRFFLKIYRKIERGINPDVELTRFLSEKKAFRHIPAFLGAIEHRRPRMEPAVIGLLVENVPNERDAWNQAIDAVGSYFERVLEARPDQVDPSRFAEFAAGLFEEQTRLLAARLAELHLALASERDDPAFAPEPFAPHYQRSLYQSMRGTTRRMVESVRKKIRQVPKRNRPEVAALVEREAEILRRQAGILRRVDALRIRVHGDLHLGQALNTGKDFVIFDFEGEPGRPLSDRRMKRSPLRDVAGMLRSFHYAAFSALWQRRAIRRVDRTLLEPWAEAWAQGMGRAFLETYLQGVRDAGLVPADDESVRILLDAYLLEKAAYEVSYELGHRPDWVVLPARGIRSILCQPIATDLPILPNGPTESAASVSAIS